MLALNGQIEIINHEIEPSMSLVYNKGFTRWQQLLKKHISIALQIISLKYLKIIKSTEFTSIPQFFIHIIKYIQSKIILTQ